MCIIAVREACCSWAAVCRKSSALTQVFASCEQRSLHACRLMLQHNERRLQGHMRGDWMTSCRGTARSWPWLETCTYRSWQSKELGCRSSTMLSCRGCGMLLVLRNIRDTSSSSKPYRHSWTHRYLQRTSVRLFCSFGKACGAFPAVFSLSLCFFYQHHKSTTSVWRGSQQVSLYLVFAN